MAEDDLMADFDVRLYGRYNDPTLTARERLQLGVARIVRTSVEDARYSIFHSDAEVLKTALKYCGGRVTLTKIIEAELKRRGKKARKA